MQLARYSTSYQLQGRVESSSAKHYISDKLDPKPLYEQLSSVKYAGLELAHLYPKS